MNKKLIFGIAILVSIFFFQNIFAEEIVRITNGEWLPYHSKKLPHYGAGSRIVTEAFALEGIKVEWGFYPWKRGYLNVVRDKWDASIGWIKTPEREKEVLFSEPVYGGKWVFFHLKNQNFSWQTIDDLKKFRIGATENFTYGALFDNAEKQKKIWVKRARTIKQNFAILLKGRIHVFVHAEDSGYATLRKHFKANEIEKVTNHPKPIQVVQYHLVFTKKEKNKRLVEVFNRGLRRLYTSGKVEKYLKEAWAAN
ncbi:transporter substrate-binding domain-containing protein [Herbaspirillum sp.]|uniref:substrate-binding periplasmic protein n=1 Tax=Herbaspirillum sp. TaxID=1890675 RepID=UPI00258DCF86|nr:transporter substrate-binding domain-containing protein [Herbaspirillum sp.]MCP3949009.1 amino acid ABC transporter substrate-binding protein [Herbaspirillum sp.]